MKSEEMLIAPIVAKQLILEISQKITGKQLG